MMMERMSMKEKKCFALMIIICASVLVFAQTKKDPDIGPEKVILDLIHAAEDSNPGQYVSCFCDELQLNLQGQVNRIGEKLFNQRITKNYKNLIGIAISDQQCVNSNLIHLRVEFVFEDYDEIRSFILKKINDDWKIKTIMNTNNA
jgi:hypothetical protein